MTWAIVALEAAVLAMSLSIDSFAAAFAYGCKKIKMPLLSVHIIDLICSCIIGASFLFGSITAQYIPEKFAVALSFSILFLIGLSKLFDSITKSIIRKYTEINKKIKLSMFNFKFILHLYADPKAADVDVSESISPREAAVLAISLSLDGLAVGFGSAMIGINGWAVVLFSFITNFIALMLGGWLGNKAADKLHFNISWLAGVVLIALAFMKLF